MTITEMLGTPVSDPAEPARPPSDPCPVPTPENRGEIVDPTTRHRAGSVLAAAVALCVGIAVGVYVIPDPAGHAPGAGVAMIADVPAGVAGFAELFVATHLSGINSAQDLAGLHPGDDEAAATGGLWVNQAATTAAVPIDENVWRVTVAVDLLERVADSYEPAGVQYFVVSVAATETQPVALSAPSRMPAPQSPVAPAPVRYVEAVPPDQERAAAGFLTAYLTGNGEVARYAAPTARIALFTAPPYASVAITNLAADSQGQVCARLTATSAGGATHALEYTLQMTYEHGIWEVLMLGPAA